ncbi:hypothetical protein [Priestia megaterium]|uniref:hypothetical protein n=1 Tax=Priestia megaterium TaxID=1404 RepID=UPI00101C569A|nr:hypothetical protein [Priestia megaterium]
MLSKVFNCAKRFAFQTLIRQKRWERELHKESIHLVMKRKFGVNDYMANSIVRESQALLKAQTELNKLYIKQTDEKIKKKKNKLKKERSFLTTLRKIKDSCVEGNLRFPKNRNYALHSSGLISLECKSCSLIWMNTYLFEHQYLDLTIKQLKAKIGRKGLGYKEKAPQVLRHHIVRYQLPYWKQWWTLNKKLNVRTEVFYQLFDVNKPSGNINLTHKELTEKESKHLKKAFA